MKNEIWRKNFEIKQADYIILSSALKDTFEFQKPTVKKNYLTKAISIFKNGDNIASYFPKNELKNYAKNILKNIIKNPERIIKIQNKTKEYNRIYFKKCEEIEKVVYKKFTDQQLVKIFYELFDLMKICHGYALGITWFVDSNGDDLSNYLTNLIKKKIKKNKLSLSAPEIFTILTTPDQESFAQQEEQEMLKIFEFIKNDKTANKIFEQENLAKIKIQIKISRKDLYKKIIIHYKKWCWTPYTYIGPAYDLDYYLRIWSSLTRQKEDPSQKIKTLARERNKTFKQRKQFLEILNLDKKEAAIFDLAAQIVWLKSFRKDVLFYGMYINDKVLKELGRRAGLSLMQMKFISGHEMKNFKKFSPAVLNQRYKFSVIYSHQGKIKIYIGRQAENYLKKFNFKKIKIINASELKGTPAFIGKAKGKVKIINLPQEMGKMNKNDIIVAHTTFPSLVPAMKKAAAIITDDGGITCHAAIVARELKIPCVVGTKIATQILKDGDLVEVDAHKGIVKIIK